MNNNIDIKFTKDMKKIQKQTTVNPTQRSYYQFLLFFICFLILSSTVLFVGLLPDVHNKLFYFIMMSFCIIYILHSWVNLYFGED
jgi:hypothetical protein